MLFISNCMILNHIVSDLTWKATLSSILSSVHGAAKLDLHYQSRIYIALDTKNVKFKRIKFKYTTYYYAIK